VWSLTDERPVVTLHAVLRENADRDRVLVEIQSTLREQFGVQHATVQIELTECEDEDCASTSAAARSPLKSGSTS
jgi:cobalt-zinc-cadmium efflux system protein